MIKIGTNFLSLRNTSIEDFIKTCYDLRLDVVDFHQRAFESTDPAYLSSIKALCLKYGLPIGYIGVSGLFHGTAAERAEHDANAKQAVALAAFPENAHWEGVDYDAETFDIQSESYREQDPRYARAARLATPHKGRIMIDSAVEWVAAAHDQIESHVRNLPRSIYSLRKSTVNRTPCKAAECAWFAKFEIVMQDAG